MLISSLLKFTQELLESEYRENIILITFFLFCYITCQKFFLKEKMTKEENLNRQKRAEEYLNKHRDDDSEFFYGALTTNTENTLINQSVN